jgi:hypothetical protein
MTPTLKVIGNSRKALLWYFFSLMISEIMVRITPILPFKKPPRSRKVTEVAKLCENPKPMTLNMVPSSPMQIAIFLPIAWQSETEQTEMRLE